MNKDLIIQILNDWNFWQQNLDTGIKRDEYLDSLEKLLPSQQIKIITGARRSGKSFIMRQLAEKLILQGTNNRNILIVNFEDPRFINLNTELLEKIFNVYLEYQQPEGKIYIFLDEIQAVKQWEKWVRMMQELNKANIFVSGSNAHLLSKELGTVLTGRHLDTTVMPLSFKEFLKFNNTQIKPNIKLTDQNFQTSLLLQKFIEFGSFPIVALEDQKKREILLSYYDDILNKDLIKRYKVRKSETLKSLVRFYFSNVSSPTTFSSAGKIVNTSAETTERFSSFLETSYLLFFLKRFSFKVKEQEKSPRKIYAIDTGLVNTIGFKFSENMGRLVENLVFLALKTKQNFNPFLEVFYWKSVTHQEVDFVIKEQNKVNNLIQVCWNVQDPLTKNREIKALLKGLEEFNLNQGTIITGDYEATEKYGSKQIKFMTLLEWLLE